MHKTKEAGINAKELEKLKGILGNDSLELLTAVKEIVNHSDKPLEEHLLCIRFISSESYCSYRRYNDDFY